MTTLRGQISTNVVTLRGYHTSISGDSIFGVLIVSDARPQNMESFVGYRQGSSFMQ